MEALRPLTRDRSAAEQARIEAAYTFAAAAHEGVKRRSGEPYITHPLAVAVILAELGMDTDSIVAGLLHDTVEDTVVTLDDVGREFGPEVRLIVEGETKVGKLAKVAKAQDPDRSLSDEQSENMRRLLIAMTRDIRIIIVKLADRLHNMRTLGAMPPLKQQRIARETMEIFAPLAHRLGIGQVKWELEDLAFRYLEPGAYAELQGRLRTRQEEREEHIRSALQQMRETLGEDIELEEWVDNILVSGRSKHLWSIYTKMTKEHKALEQIFDLLAIRVILTPRPLSGPALSGGPPRDPAKQERAEELREKRVCYHSLSIVHSMWTPIPGRFKDYIAVPKPNGYQSLHTTVISPSGQPVEVQIRSRRMHEVAEFGVAAHWLYKQGSRADEHQRGGWLQRLQQLQHEILDASDFVDAVKDDLLGGRVVVFTPRGDTRDLPSGSTPIDFAYNVHSRIGDTATGARVNGSIVPLSYQLQNGDMVEIITSRQGGPSKDWLSFAVTRSARTKIRHHFRAEERAEALQHGHDLLERYLRKRQLPVRQLMRTKLLEDAADRLTGNRNPDDLYLALHAGKLTTGAVARTLAPQLESERLPGRLPLRPPPLSRAAPVLPEAERVYVEGTLTQAKRAMCCNPIPGDQIMAYVTRGRGYTVHRIDCPNMVRLLKDEPEDRCRPASWNPSQPGVSVVDLDVLAQDRAGLLADVLAALVRQQRSPLKVEAGVRGPGAHILLRLEVGGQQDLALLADAIRAVAGVSEVVRVGNRAGRSIPTEARPG